MRGWRAKLFLIIMGLLLGLFVLEGALRFFFPGAFVLPLPQYAVRKNESLGYELTPNFKGRLKRADFDIRIEINSSGLRDREFKEKKEPGVYRILGIGDSFTLGYGVEAEECYLKVLERLLNVSGKKRYEVINAGVLGYCTRQELTYLKEKGISWEPDLVIYGFYPNDILENIKPYDTVIDGFCVSQVKSQRPLLHLQRFLQLHFRFYPLLVDGLKRFRWSHALAIRLGLTGGTHLFSLEKKERGWETTKELILQMNQLLKEKGIKLVVVSIPVKDDIHPELPHYAPYFYQYLYDARDILGDFCKENEFPFCDIYPSMKETAQEGEAFYYRAAGHWNVSAHSLAGEEIRDFLLERVIE